MSYPNNYYYSASHYMHQDENGVCYVFPHHQGGYTYDRNNPPPPYGPMPVAYSPYGGTSRPYSPPVNYYPSRFAKSLQNSGFPESNTPRPSSPLASVSSPLDLTVQQRDMNNSCSTAYTESLPPTTATAESTPDSKQSPSPNQKAMNAFKETASRYRISVCSEGEMGARSSASISSSSNASQGETRATTLSGPKSAYDLSLENRFKEKVKSHGLSLEFPPGSSKNRNLEEASGKLSCDTDSVTDKLQDEMYKERKESVDDRYMYLYSGISHSTSEESFHSAQDLSFDEAKKSTNRTERKLSQDKLQNDMDQLDSLFQNTKLYYSEDSLYTTDDCSRFQEVFDETSDLILTKQIDSSSVDAKVKSVNHLVSKRSLTENPQFDELEEFVSDYVENIIAAAVTTVTNNKTKGPVVLEKTYSICTEGIVNDLSADKCLQCNSNNNKTINKDFSKRHINHLTLGKNTPEPVSYVDRKNGLDGCQSSNTRDIGTMTEVLNEQPALVFRRDPSDVDYKQLLLTVQRNLIEVKYRWLTEMKQVQMTNIRKAGACKEHLTSSARKNSLQSLVDTEITGLKQDLKILEMKRHCYLKFLKCGEPWIVIPNFFEEEVTVNFADSQGSGDSLVQADKGKHPNYDSNQNIHQFPHLCHKNLNHQRGQAIPKNHFTGNISSPQQLFLDDTKNSDKNSVENDHVSTVGSLLNDKLSAYDVQEKVSEKHKSLSTDIHSSSTPSQVAEMGNSDDPFPDFTSQASSDFVFDIKIRRKPSFDEHVDGMGLRLGHNETTTDTDGSNDPASNICAPPHVGHHKLSSPTVSLPPVHKLSSPTVSLPPVHKLSSPTVSLPPVHKLSSPTVSLPPVHKLSSPTVSLPPVHKLSSPTVSLPPVQAEEGLQSCATNSVLSTIPSLSYLALRQWSKSNISRVETFSNDFQPSPDSYKNVEIFQSNVGTTLKKSTFFDRGQPCVDDSLMTRKLDIPDESLSVPKSFLPGCHLILEENMQPCVDNMPTPGGLNITRDGGEGKDDNMKDCQDFNNNGSIFTKLKSVTESVDDLSTVTEVQRASEREVQEMNEKLSVPCSTSGNTMGDNSEGLIPVHECSPFKETPISEDVGIAEDATAFKEVTSTDTVTLTEEVVLEEVSVIEEMPTPEKGLITEEITITKKAVITKDILLYGEDTFSKEKVSINLDSVNRDEETDMSCVTHCDADPAITSSTNETSSTKADENKFPEIVKEDVSILSEDSDTSNDVDFSIFTMDNTVAIEDVQESRSNSSSPVMALEETVHDNEQGLLRSTKEARELETPVDETAEQKITAELEKVATENKQNKDVDKHRASTCKSIENSDKSILNLTDSTEEFHSPLDVAVNQGKTIQIEKSAVAYQHTSENNQTEAADKLEISTVQPFDNSERVSQNSTDPKADKKGEKAQVAVDDGFEENKFNPDTANETKHHKEDDKKVSLEKRPTEDVNKSSPIEVKPEYCISNEKIIDEVNNKVSVENKSCVLCTDDESKTVSEIPPNDAGNESTPGVVKQADGEDQKQSTDNRQENANEKSAKENYSTIKTNEDVDNTKLAEDKLVCNKSTCTSKKAVEKVKENKDVNQNISDTHETLPDKNVESKAALEKTDLKGQHVRPASTKNNVKSVENNPETVGVQTESVQTESLKDKNTCTGYSVKDVSCQTPATAVPTGVLSKKSSSTPLTKNKDDKKQSAAVLTVKPKAKTESSAIVSSDSKTTESSAIVSSDPKTTESSVMSSKPKTTESSAIVSSDPKTTESSVMSSKPTTTESSAMPSKPKTTESSAVLTSKPKTTESSAVLTSKPTTTESSAMPSKPKTTESSAVLTSKPKTTESSVMLSSKPKTTESSAVLSSKPTTTESSAMPSKPKTTESSSVLTSKPTTTDSSAMPSKPKTTESSSVLTSKPKTTESSVMLSSKPNTTESIAMLSSKPKTTESSAVLSGETKTAEINSSKTSSKNKSKKRKKSGNNSEQANGKVPSTGSSQASAMEKLLEDKHEQIQISDCNIDNSLEGFKIVSNSKKVRNKSGNALCEWSAKPKVLLTDSTSMDALDSFDDTATKAKVQRKGEKSKKKGQPMTTEKIKVTKNQQDLKPSGSLEHISSLSESSQENGFTVVSHSRKSRHQSGSVLLGRAADVYKPLQGGSSLDTLDTFDIPAAKPFPKSKEKTVIGKDNSNDGMVNSKEEKSSTVGMVSTNVTASNFLNNVDLNTKDKNISVSSANMKKDFPQVISKHLTSSHPTTCTVLENTEHHEGLPSENCISSSQNLPVNACTGHELNHSNIIPSSIPSSKPAVVNQTESHSVPVPGAALGGNKQIGIKKSLLKTPRTAILSHLTKPAVQTKVNTEDNLRPQSPFMSWVGSTTPVSDKSTSHHHEQLLGAINTSVMPPPIPVVTCHLGTSSTGHPDQSTTIPFQAANISSHQTSSIYCGFGTAPNSFVNPAPNSFINPALGTVQLPDYNSSMISQVTGQPLFANFSGSMPCNVSGANPVSGYFPPFSSTSSSTSRFSQPLVPASGYPFHGHQSQSAFASMGGFSSPCQPMYTMASNSLLGSYPGQPVASVHYPQTSTVSLQTTHQTLVNAVPGSTMTKTSAGPLDMNLFELVKAQLIKSYPQESKSLVWLHKTAEHQTRVLQRHIDKNAQKQPTDSNSTDKIGDTKKQESSTPAKVELSVASKKSSVKTPPGFSSSTNKVPSVGETGNQGSGASVLRNMATEVDERENVHSCQQKPSLTRDGTAQLQGYYGSQTNRDMVEPNSQRLTRKRQDHSHQPIAAVEEVHKQDNDQSNRCYASASKRKGGTSKSTSQPKGGRTVKVSQLDPITRTKVTETNDNDWQQVPTKKRREKSADSSTSSATNSGKTPKSCSNFERLVTKMTENYAGLTRSEITDVISEVRRAHSGLSGLSLKEIVQVAKPFVTRVTSKRSGKHASEPSPGSSLVSSQIQTTCAGVLPTSYRNRPLYNSQKLIMPNSLGQLAKRHAEQGRASTQILDMDDKEEDICVICHDGLSCQETKTLDCGHIFHTECIKEWVLKRERTCPNCRRLALFPEEFPKLGK